MIYSLCVVPITIIALIMSVCGINLKTYLLKHRVELAIVFLMLAVNVAAFFFNIKTHITSTDVYTFFLLGLVVHFSEKNAILIASRPLVFFLFLNVIICVLETQLGLMSVVVDTFHQPYLSFSQFLTSNSSLNSNTGSVIRNVNNYITVIRPSGLFSNLHLSSFAMFCFFGYLNLRREHKIIQYIIVFLILIGGTLQTILCLSIYLILCSLKNLKKILILSFLIITPLIFYALTIYGPQKSKEANNMFRIISDSIQVFETLPLKTLLWGDNIYDVIAQSGGSIIHPEMLIESGILRYTVSIGLVNIAFVIALFFKIFLSDRRVDKRAYFFIIASLGTYAHYFMSTTFLGGILVIFVFKSYQLESIKQQDGMNDIKEKHKEKSAISIFKWIAHK